MSNRINYGYMHFRPISVISERFVFPSNGFQDQNNPDNYSLRWSRTKVEMRDSDTFDWKL